MNWWIANRTWIANRWNAKRESLNRESRETADSESRIAETQLWNAETQSYTITEQTKNKTPVNQVHYWYICLIKGPDIHTRFKADIVIWGLHEHAHTQNTPWHKAWFWIANRESLKRTLKRETLKRESLKRWNARNAKRWNAKRSCVKRAIRTPQP